MLPRSTIVAATATLALCAAGIAYQSQPLPPGHPPTRPQLPPGHPTLDETGAAPAVADPIEWPAAAPEDVGTPAAVICAFYESISGGKDEIRDWNRFRSLFMGGARLMTTRASGDRAAPVILTPDEYVEANQTYFEGGGYFEQELHQTTDRFGRIAHVFSTYASRRRADADPYSRGVNSFQLMFDGERWWIASLIWDHERSADNPLQPEHLPGE
jgi:hypothetical protein